MGKRASEYRPRHAAAAEVVQEGLTFEEVTTTDHGWRKELAKTSFGSILIERLNERTQTPKYVHEEQEVICLVLGGRVFSVVHNEDLDEQVPARALAGQAITIKAGKSFVVSTVREPATLVWMTSAEFWDEAEELEPGVAEIQYEGEEAVEVSPPPVGGAPAPVPSPLPDENDTILPPAMQQFKEHWAQTPQAPRKRSVDPARARANSEAVQAERDAQRGSVQYKGGEAPPPGPVPPSAGVAATPVNPMPVTPPQE